MSGLYKPLQTKVVGQVETLFWNNSHFKKNVYKYKICVNRAEHLAINCKFFVMFFFKQLQIIVAVETLLLGTQ